MTPPDGICFDQYRVQAKELLKSARAADPEAAARIQRQFPKPGAAILPGRVRLADCQFVIARELGYTSWTKLKQDLLFRNAVAAIDAGDLTGLDTLLREYPTLIGYRCRLGKWYEQGYFRGAALLHHVAGNPIRCPLPANIIDIARTLLNHGADPNMVTEGGSTTIGLLLTSRQASEARIAVALMDLLRASGATDDASGPEVLSLPLLNAAPGTAAELIKRGAPMDIRHAAGLERLDAMRSLLAAEPEPLIREEALVFAAIRGQEEAVRLLTRHGARGDALVGPAGMTPRTALHEAASRGHIGIVRQLLDNGADAAVIEPRFGGTAAGWARHGGYMEIAALLERGQKSGRDSRPTD